MNKKEMGRLSRRRGMEFERDVRKALTDKGWTIQKSGNNIDLENNDFIQAKSNRFRVVGGFPDFIGFKLSGTQKLCKLFQLIFVECKTNNTLDKTEKLKMNWLLENNYNGWIAYLDNNEVKFRRWETYTPNKKK